MPSDAGVAPENAELQEDIFAISADEIAQAAGITDTFIDKPTSDDGEESEPENEERAEEEPVEEESGGGTQGRLTRNQKANRKIGRASQASGSGSG